MSVCGIDEITFATSDLARCRQFHLDWGLTLQSESQQLLVFTTLNGCTVRVAHSELAGLPAGIEPDPTVREVVWGVESAQDLALYRDRIRQQPGFIDLGERMAIDLNHAPTKRSPLISEWLQIQHIAGSTNALNLVVVD